MQRIEFNSRAVNPGSIGLNSYMLNPSGRGFFCRLKNPEIEGTLQYFQFGKIDRPTVNAD